jgi:Protein of unknown function (DUF3017)
VLTRAVQWIAEQFTFLIVLMLLCVAFGYLIVDPGRWGRGAGLVAVAALLAGLLRAVLPMRRVGLLAVRSRWVDAACYLALGGAILAVDIRLHT